MLSQGIHSVLRVSASASIRQDLTALFCLQCSKRMQAHQRRMIDEQLSNKRREYYPVNDLEELSAWLAGHMPQLQTLSLFVSYCPELPLMQQLVHLELRAIEFKHLNDSLQQMHGLRTALLACMRMEAVLDILDVSGLACLKQLSLQDVYPEVLLIPEGCRLDLQGEADTMQQVLPDPCVSHSVNELPGLQEYTMRKNIYQRSDASTAC